MTIKKTGIILLSNHYTKLKDPKKKINRGIKRGFYGVTRKNSYKLKK